MISRLIIDGRSYLTGMQSIANSGDFLNLSDIYHSPGFQIYLGFLYRTLGYPADFIFKMKLIAWGLTLLALGIIVFIGERFFGRGAGWIAALFLSYSNCFRVYQNLTQYEVVAGFGFTLVNCLFLQLLSKKSPRQAWKFSLPGALIAALGLINARFVMLGLSGFVGLWLKRRSMKGEVMASKNQITGRAFFFFFYPIVLILGGWSLYHSIRLHRLILISDAIPSFLTLDNHLKAGAFSSPFPEEGHPSGLAFILSHPFHFLRLVAQRGACLWGIDRDLWAIDHPLITKWFPAHREEISPLWPWIFLLTFLIGCISKLRSDLRTGKLPNHSFLYLGILGGSVGPLLLHSSHRYLIPLLPVIFLFQSYAVVEGLFWVKRFGAGSIAFAFSLGRPKQYRLPGTIRRKVSRGKGDLPVTPIGST